MTKRQPPYLCADAAPEATDAIDAEISRESQAAIVAHQAAVQAWLRSAPADRALRWRAVEAAYRACKQCGSYHEAARHTAALMRASGKMWSIG
jgi:hypothetical protein